MKNESHYNPYLKENARSLRNSMTKAEACLWKYVLRANGLGVPFRRQRPVDRYIADFMCIQLKLIIEVDGYTHSWEEVAKNDKIRQKRLEELGFKVVRFSDEEVLTGINGVYDCLVEVLEERKKELGLPTAPDSSNRFERGGD